MNKHKKNFLSRNLKASLAYLLIPFPPFPLAAFFLLLLEKKNAFVRYHAFQAVIFYSFLFLLYFVFSLTLIGLIITPFFLIVQFVIWLILIWQTIKGELFALPYIGRWIKKQLLKKAL